MAARDPVTILLTKAAHRYNSAERSVATLQAQLARGVGAPHHRQEEVRSLLAQRIAERDAALQQLQGLQSRPRWLLAKELAETS